MTLIPLVRPNLPAADNIEHYFQMSRESGQYSNFGPCYNLLTERLGSMLDRHVVPVSNGTAAIQIAIQTHFNRGDRIGLPDYTHIGTYQAIIAAGCIPELFPVDRSSWTLDPEVIKTRKDIDGFIVVSPFGYHVDFEMYDSIAKDNKKTIIYDLAGAWGIQVDTKNTVCYSLHATKNFSCGEGGLIAYFNANKAAQAKRLTNFDTLPDRTIASHYGGNHKPDDLKCAIALAQLDDQKSIMEKIGRKRHLMDFYQKNLKDFCIPHDLYVFGAPSLCVVAGLPAERIEARAQGMGFMAKKYYPLLSEMEGLRFKNKTYTPSIPFFRTCLALPSDVTDDEANFVVDSVLEIILDARDQ